MEFPLESMSYFLQGIIYCSKILHNTALSGQKAVMLCALNYGLLEITTIRLKDERVKGSGKLGNKTFII